MGAKLRLAGALLPPTSRIAACPACGCTSTFTSHTASWGGSGPAARYSSATCTVPWCQQQACREGSASESRPGRQPPEAPVAGTWEGEWAPVQTEHRCLPASLRLPNEELAWRAHLIQRQVALSANHRHQPVAAGCGTLPPLPLPLPWRLRRAASGAGAGAVTVGGCGPKALGAADGRLDGSRAGRGWCLCKQASRRGPWTLSARCAGGA